MSAANESLSERVYRQLLEQLAERRLRPGQVINRRATAAALGVSLAPVAEAFGALTRDGLFETMPRQGTRVRSFTRADAREQAALRLAIETQVARIICGRTVAGARGELAPLARRLDAPRGPRAQRWQMEVDFHRRLAALTGHTLLVQTLTHVLQLSFFSGLQAGAAAGPPASAAGRHGTLLRRLERGDADAAAAAMRRHLLEGSMHALAVESPESLTPS